MTAPTHTPGPWRWQGEDYLGGWGWQMLVGPAGEGIIVGQAVDGSGPEPRLRAFQPVEPSLCITGMSADGKDCVQPVHVLQRDAALIAAAPQLLATLRMAVDKIIEASAQNHPAYWSAADIDEIVALIDAAEGRT